MRMPILLQTDMEIYTTIVRYDLSKRIQNVNYQYVGADGKFDKSWNAKTNQQWHVTSEKWLKEQIYDKLAKFVGDKCQHHEDPIRMGITQQESYVLMKSMEDQQRYLNPIVEIEPGPEVLNET